jgi:hypothetical protein
MSCGAAAEQQEPERDAYVVTTHCRLSREKLRSLPIVGSDVDDGDVEDRHEVRRGDDGGFQRRGSSSAIQALPPIFQANAPAWGVFRSSVPEVAAPVSTIAAPAV